MNIADELTKKAGPLPVWAWLGIGGGVLLLILGRGGGGGSSTSPAPTSTGGLDTSGLAGGALDLGAIAPVAPFAGGGSAGGFEDPIATPGTSSPAPVGGGSPDSPGAVTNPAPLALGISINPDGSINLGAPLAGDLASDPATVAALSDPTYSGALQAMQTPNGMLFSTKTLIPRAGQPVADIGSDGFSNTPALDWFSADNADATHVLVSPISSPAGAIAFATTPQTPQPNGGVAVQISTVPDAPALSHPSLYTEGSIVPAGTAQVA